MALLIKIVIRRVESVTCSVAEEEEEVEVEFWAELLENWLACGLRSLQGRGEIVWLWSGNGRGY